MCKDCGCSLGDLSGSHSHAHSHGGHTHTHEHTHEGEHNHNHHHDHAGQIPTLKESKTIEVIGKILSQNDHEAEHNRAHLDEKGLLCVNLMSSPGAGKTTLLEAILSKTNLKIGVVEGDLETNKDAQRISDAGGVAWQVSTGQTCHLDAFMVHNALHHIDLDAVDVVFVENVGNLVCPAAYDVGAHMNVVLLSVPEGSDKIAKYPVMFRAADAVVVTKTSLLQHFDFNLDEAKASLRKLNPKADFFAIDSKSGEGLEKFLDYLRLKMACR